MAAIQKALQVSQQAMKFLAGAKGFDRVLQKVQVIEATPGTVKAQLTVTEEDVNPYGTLHGGYVATVVDMISTMALVNSEPALPGVSVDISISYMKPAKLGETVTIDAITLKKGSKLGFCTVDFRNSAGQLIAQGKHTKFLEVGSWAP